MYALLKVSHHDIGAKKMEYIAVKGEYYAPFGDAWIISK